MNSCEMQQRNNEMPSKTPVQNVSDIYRYKLV